MDNLQYMSKDGQAKGIDIMSLVSINDASDASTGVILELLSPSHRWRFAPIDFDEGRVNVSFQ